MGLHYQILLPMLSLFLVRVDLTDLYPLRVPVKVLKIYDGDTLLVRYGKQDLKVRVVKIDSPEMGQPFFGSSQDAGLYSRNCLLKFLNMNSFHVLTIEKRDVYGRVLGDLDGLSLKLIQKGCTTLYPYASFRSRKEKLNYVVSLNQAKSKRIGIWRHGGFRQPKLWRKFNKQNVGRQ